MVSCRISFLLMQDKTQRLISLQRCHFTLEISTTPAFQTCSEGGRLHDNDEAEDDEGDAMPGIPKYGAYATSRFDTSNGHTNKGLCSDAADQEPVKERLDRKCDSVFMGCLPPMLSARGPIRTKLLRPAVCSYQESNRVWK